MQNRKLSAEKSLWNSLGDSISTTPLPVAWVPQSFVMPMVSIVFFTCARAVLKTLLMPVTSFLYKLWASVRPSKSALAAAGAPRNSSRRV